MNKKPNEDEQDQVVSAPPLTALEQFDQELEALGIPKAPADDPVYRSGTILRVPRQQPVEPGDEKFAEVSDIPRRVSTD